MSFVKCLLGVIRNLLKSSFGSLGVAEVRMYGWDGAANLWARTSWTDFYGDSYEVQANAGIVTTQAGGWVDVLGITSLDVTAIVRGLDASCAGQVILRFQAANSLQDPAQQWERDDLVVRVNTNGTSIVYGQGTFDLSGIAFLRLYKIESLASHNVMAGAKASSVVKPVRV